MTEILEIQKIKGLLSGGDTQFQSANYREALKKYRNARQLSKRAGNLLYQGFAINNIGLVRDALGQYRRARNKYKKTLKLFDQLQMGGDQNLTISRAVVLNNLGMANTNLKRFEKAAQHYQTALSILERLEIDIGEAFQQDSNLQERKGQVLHNIGFNLSRQGRTQVATLQAALQSYREALPLRKTPANKAETLNGLAFTDGLLVENSGNLQPLEEARQSLASAIKLYQSSDPPDLDGLASTFDSLGNILSIASQYRSELLTEALDAYQQSIELVEQILASLDSVEQETYLQRIRTTYTYQAFLEASKPTESETPDKHAVHDRVLNLLGLLNSLGLYSLPRNILNERLSSALPWFIRQIGNIG